jgi:uncharacterized Tic20 family protein/DNA-binding Xre family transcriptional regulator
MKQPELGLKVSELRQQQGLTQEQLAERCEVSTRTIQRIESGEVDPRAFTINRLNEVLGFDFGLENEENENLWLAVLHLSSIIPLVVVPLLVWSWKKNQSRKIEKQGKDVLNFQITMMLLLFAASFLLFLAPIIMVGMAGALDGINLRLGVSELMILMCPLPLILIGIFSTVQAVINTARALSEKPYRYLLSIPFIK